MKEYFCVMTLEVHDESTGDDVCVTQAGVFNSKPGTVETLFDAMHEYICRKQGFDTDRTTVTHFFVTPNKL